MTMPFTKGKEYFSWAQIPLSFREDPDLSILKGKNNFFTIIFAKEGSGILRIGEKNRSFVTPSVFCIGENIPVELIREQNLKSSAIYFHPCFVNDTLSIETINNNYNKSFETMQHDSWLLKQLFPREKAVINQIDVGPISEERIRTLFSQINMQFNEQKDNFWPCRGRSYFIELLILLERLLYKYDPFIDEFPESKEFEEIYPVILHLNNFYPNRITVSDIVKLFNTNRTSLTEKFVKATGYTPINYLIKLRIKIAGVLLEDTSIPVFEIIERIGFDDQAHFGRMFKKYTGLSPSSYREKFQTPSYLKK